MSVALGDLPDPHFERSKSERRPTKGELSNHQTFIYKSINSVDPLQFLLQWMYYEFH